ncbi:MAG: hypothetical protein ABSG24_08820 [Acidimicrobiales bacterium]
MTRKFAFLLVASVVLVVGALGARTVREKARRGPGTVDPRRDGSEHDRVHDGDSTSVNQGSWRSRGSIGSARSIGSIGSFCSIGSVGSSFSIGSIGSSWSIGSIGSFASVASVVSVGSVCSVASLFSRFSVRSVGARQEGSPRHLEGGS